MKEKEYTALIILNYNNYEDTLSCIDSVEAYNTAPVKYIVVDNGSTREDTVATLDNALKQKFCNDYICLKAGQHLHNVLPKLTFVINPKNEGYAVGNNHGLKLASDDDSIKYIMILNNDVLFVEDIIPKLLEAKAKLPDCAIISPALYKKDMSDYDTTCARLAPSPWSLIKECLMVGMNNNHYRDVLKKKYWLFVKDPKLKNAEILEIEMPSGSCMLIEKSLFEKIGYFDTHTFLYFEENILYSKIYSRGLKNYLLPQLSCIHLGASSTKKEPGYFIQKCGLDSRTYYLKAYCHLNLLEKIIYAVAYGLMSFRLFALKNLKHR